MAEGWHPFQCYGAATRLQYGEPVASQFFLFLFFVPLDPFEVVVYLVCMIGVITSNMLECYGMYGF